MSQTPLPNFFIVGVAKAGTTSLHRYLSQHPEVFMSPIKETNFFAYEERAAADSTAFPIRTLTEYAELFRDAGMAAAIGESSPRYFGSPVAARRIKELIPDAKIIVSLRDPVDRAISGYFMQVRQGRERRPLAEAISSDAHFVKVSFYFERLRRYFDVFGPAAVKIILFDDLESNAVSTVQELFEFVGVDASFTPDISTRHNSGGVPRSEWLHKLLKSQTLRDMVRPLAPAALKAAARTLQRRNLVSPPEVSPELRSKLREQFHDDTMQVEALIGRDLSIWREQASATTAFSRQSHGAIKGS
jgi:hypothetical protein